MSDTMPPDTIRGETIQATDGFSTPEAPPDAPPTQVFIAVPTRGVIVTDAFAGLCCPSLGKRQCQLQHESTSAMTRNFNKLLHDARLQKPRAQFFAMHHDDVSVPPGWVDTLIEELEKFDADVVSAVIPIKDHRGLTTTGVFSKDGHYLRRFTMREVMQYPDTFNAETCGFAGHKLVINTGLFVMRMDRPWVQKLCFRFEDEFAKTKEPAPERGDVDYLCRSEDWLFSEDLAVAGARVFATRKVPVRHWGTSPYGNDAAWGAWQQDSTGGGTGWARWR